MVVRPDVHKRYLQAELMPDVITFALEGIRGFIMIEVNDHGGATGR